VALTGAEVAARLAVVRERIASAGARPDDVTIVAVTKGHGPAAATAALDVGLADLGESYASELLATRASTAGGGPCRWHFLGHVQRNKVRALAAAVDLWQAVDRVAAGQEIARRAPGAQVLVQVNVSGELRKHGCSLHDTPELVDDLAALGLDVRGLMAIGPTGPPGDARPGFRQVVALAEHLGLPERSIGMSDDLEVGVAEGATMVRVGRALFGPRNGGPDTRR
jgi:pyridoxal phosphate enzyme (YggS family)